MTMDFESMVEKHGITASGVIQIGCNEAQEDTLFDQLGIKHKIYIEPCAKAFDVLSKKFSGNKNVILFNYACGEKSETRNMFVESSNNGQSNSLLKPYLHEEIYPNIVFDKNELVQVIRLDDLDFKREEYPLLVMDCQGGEGMIIKGAENSLKHINWIYTEVMTAELYKNCVLMQDLDRMLPDFERIETTLTPCHWGDALYKRRDIK